MKYPFIFLICLLVAYQCSAQNSFPGCQPLRTNAVVINNTGEPYKTVCHLRVTRRKFLFFRTHALSTGTLISPTAILTAGHTVLHYRRITEIEVTPDATASTQPFGKFILTRQNGLKLAETAPGFTNQPEKDYGIIVMTDDRVYKAVNSIKTPALFDDMVKNNSDILQIDGYTASFNGDLVEKNTTKANIQETADYVLYDMYTEHGDSGAPIFTVVNGQNYLIGVHNTGHYHNSNCNGGVKITKSLLSWLTTEINK